MWQWNDGTMELYHYGVKGMKWGVRKARPQGDATGIVRRKQKKAEINKNIKDYRKKYDSASAQSDHADALWKDANRR